MTNIIQNNVNAQTKQNNRSSFTQDALGIAGGAGAGFGLRKSINYLTKPYYKAFYKNLNKFTPHENKLFTQEAERMIKESDLVKKGFNGINWIEANNKKAAEDAVNEITEGIEKKALKLSFKEELTFSFIAITAPFSKLAKILTGQFKKTNNKNDLLESVKTGCFEPFTNRIFTAQPSSALHEIGHAINNNTNFLTKIPKNLSMISKQGLIPLAILTAIFTEKPKEESNKESTKKSFSDKSKEFIHKHIGLTVAALFIPTLIEEGLASIHAVNFAKTSKVLSEATKTQQKKSLLIAYGTYLLGTVGLASVTALTVYVKDKIIEHTTKK